MDQDLYDKGMKIRREVLGDAYVDRALSKSGPFNDPLQELVTTYCWGWNWGREGLPRRDRRRGRRHFTDVAGPAPADDHRAA